VDYYSGLIDRLSINLDISLKDISSKVTILLLIILGSLRTIKARI